MRKATSHIEKIKHFALSQDSCLGRLVDQENLDKGITPFVRIKPAFTGANKTLGDLCAGTAFEAFYKQLEATSAYLGPTDLLPKLANK
jgi:hypothetical protein